MDSKPIGLESLEDFEASLVSDDDANTLRLLDTHHGEGEPAKASVPSGKASKPSKGESSASDAEPHERWIGKRLARFRLMRILGSGTMGVVFQVEDVNLHRIAALKVLRKRVREGEKSRRVERFLLEARSAAAIDHPSIAQVYEINHHDGWWYIAMEFLEGGSLRDLVNANGPLAPDHASMMAMDAARALAAGHEAGVIHRDIKPGNLMLTRRGRCKLVDFGLVKLDSAENPFQGDDEKTVIGTPLFAPPELATKQGATPASDVYSLGATFYSLLTGQPPFVGSTLDEILDQHVNAPVPDVRGLAPACSPALSDLLTRSMAKDPSARPTAAMFAAALQAQVAATRTPDHEGSGIFAQAGVPPAAYATPASGTAFRTPDIAGQSAGGSSLGLMDEATAGPEATRIGAAPSRERTWVWPLVALVSVVALLATVGGVVGWMLSSRQSLEAPVVANERKAITNGIDMRLVPIRAGSFMMGSPPAEQHRNSDERRVQVTLTGDLFMSATEVTQAQWAQVMGADYEPPEGLHPNETSGLRFHGDTLPAYVSWFEAMEFCRRLSQRESLLYRLPTEAEWEYACRAGTRGAFSTGEVLMRSDANIDTGTSSSRPMPVASFAPNAWGLYDMHGNVMEWCSDWAGPYALGPLTDPQGPTDGASRVLRGGSFDTPERVARSANRWSNPPVVRADFIGFRVVVEPDSQPPDVPPFLLTRTDRPPRDAVASASSVVEAAEVAEVDDRLAVYEPEATPRGRLRSTGSDTMDRLLSAWGKDFGRYQPGLMFRHDGKGSGTAMGALIEGVASIGPMSRPLRLEEENAFQSERGYRPTQVMVGMDAIVVLAHPTNPVVERGLTLDELDAVFSWTRKRGHSGAVSSWGDLGLSGRWSEAPITLYGRNSASGTYRVFKSAVLSDGSFKHSLFQLIGSEELINAIASDPYAIGYGGVGYAGGRVRPVPLASSRNAPFVAPDQFESFDAPYPLQRPLYVTMDIPPGVGPSAMQREFLRYVYSRQGQERLSQLGFFPLTLEQVEEELRTAGISSGGSG